jgi:hypothetical protein
MIDEKQLAMLVGAAPCRMLAKKLPDGRIAIFGANEIAASKSLSREVGIAMGVEMLMTTTP